VGHASEREVGPEVADAMVFLKPADTLYALVRSAEVVVGEKAEKPRPFFFDSAPFR